MSSSRFRIRRKATSSSSPGTRQTVLCARAPQTEQEREAAELFSAMTLQAVQDEDYKIGFGIQEAIRSGANTEFLFGRNEPAVQHYHQWVARFSV